MQLGYPETLVTPSEASFIQRSLISEGLEGELRDRIRKARIDWAVSVAPEELSKEYEGADHGELVLHSLIRAHLGKEVGEVISLNLDNVELSIVRTAVRYALEQAKEAAAEVDQTYAAVEADAPSTERLNEDHVEIFKGSMFEDALADIQMGHFIINTINAYYPE